jgi:hypothetical protein
MLSHCLLMSAKRKALKRSEEIMKTQIMLFLEYLVLQNFILEQFTSKKLSLLLTVQKQNTKSLQLFTKIIKMESIYSTN